MTTALPNTNFGASVVPVQQRTHEEGELQRPQLLESPALTPAPSNEDMSSNYTQEKHIPSHSPLYQHPSAPSDHVNGRQNSKFNFNTYEKDLESGHPTPMATDEETNPFTSHISVDHNQECKMWPSKQTLMRQKTQEKTKQRQLKGFAALAPLRERWSSLERKQKLYIKIAIAFLLVGIAVALGVGISKAVHGTYYGGHGEQENVGHTNKRSTKSP